MICFRDMTFCSAACMAADCPRRFDSAQEADARRWWGGDNAPVAMADLSPTCPDYAPEPAAALRSQL